MKGCGTSIVQLGILAVLFAVFGGVWWCCDSVVGLSSPYPMFIATATLAALFVGFFWWMIALQKKEDGIIGTIEHPFFGTVKQKRESWETSMTVPDLGSDSALSSYEGNEPTENQQNTVNWLSDLAETITEQLDDGLSRSMLEHGPQRALAIPTPHCPRTAGSTPRIGRA